jgi:hypothetical protein
MKFHKLFNINTLKMKLFKLFYLFFGSQMSFQEKNSLIMNIENFYMK